MFSLPLKLVESLQRSIKSASKSFSKAITALQVGLEHDNSVVFQLGHVLEACKSLWAVKSWLAGGKISHDEGELALFASVCNQFSLTRHLSHYSRVIRHLRPSRAARFAAATPPTDHAASVSAHHSYRAP